MAYECPLCGWPLYNRHRATCEFRGGTVSGELLLTTEQRSVLGRLKEDESKRRASFGSGGEEPSDVYEVFGSGRPFESGEQATVIRERRGSNRDDEG